MESESSFKGGGYVHVIYYDSKWKNKSWKKNKNQNSM